MHVEVSARQVTVTPEHSTPLLVTLSNTGDLIAGYAIRVLGADPGWVELETDELSLFPSESRSLTASVTVPRGVPAGDRRIAVQVRELTDPGETVIEEIVLTVPEDRAVEVRLDQPVVTAGRTARFGLLLDNTGNTAVSGVLAGSDPEAKVRFRFTPPRIELQPGEHAVVDLSATSRRPLTGAPTIRPLELHLRDQDAEPTTADDAAPRSADSPPAAPDAPPIAAATFVQRALFSRGIFSLVGLLAAITIFALVITFAFAQVLGQSAADRNLALQIAAARDGGATTGSSGLGGVVRLLTSGKPVPAVSVSVFAADDTSTPLATTATGDDGTFSVESLPAGDYKMSFRGAGFVELWFPQSLDESGAETITLANNSRRAGLDVALGGVPATVSGRVVGDDVSAATLTLMAPAEGAGAGTDPGAVTAATATSGATVTQVPIGADGTFTLTDVPSPSVYDLVVTKAGHATAVQRVDVAAGEERTGIELTLQKGDGVISGQVSSAAGPLPEVTLTATSGGSTVSTMSLTEDSVGSFTLRGLPTPATFTLVASKQGYASQTLTLTLAEGQELTGVSITLGSSAGEISGRVAMRPGQQPAPGVAVVITDGNQTIQTVTQSSGEIGQWRVAGLTIPGTYTVTFQRADLAQQTLSVSLDGSGQITPGSQGVTITDRGIEVTMHRQTASLSGTVRQRLSATSSRHRPVGEVTVQLSSGSRTYTVTSASVPAAKQGEYQISNIPPGTYTVSVGRAGVSPTSTIIELTAGQDRTYSPILAAPASIKGTVRAAGTNAPVGPGWAVQLFRASEYPQRPSATTTTDSDGRYSFDDIDAPETYVVQARPTLGSAAAGSTTVQIQASEQLTANIQVEQ